MLNYATWPPLGEVTKRSRNQGVSNSEASQKWAARSSLNGRSVDLGSDDTAIAAAPKSSQFTGVSFQTRRQKWEACIYLNGCRLYLGLHATELAAAQAYDRCARDYADKKLNFPTDAERAAGRGEISIYLYFVHVNAIEISTISSCVPFFKFPMVAASPPSPPHQARSAPLALYTRA